MSPKKKTRQPAQARGSIRFHAVPAGSLQLFNPLLCVLLFGVTSLHHCFFQRCLNTRRSDCETTHVEIPTHISNVLRKQWDIFTHSLADKNHSWRIMGLVMRKCVDKLG